MATIATGSLALAATQAQAATATAGKNWLAPLDLGPAPASVQKGLVPRVGLTNSGRGTVAWNQAGDGTILSRDFTAGGTVGPLTSPTKGSLVADVARDAAGNVIVTARAPARPRRAELDGHAAPRTAATGSSAPPVGPFVNAPAAFGLKSGFLVAATSSFTPTTAEAGLPTAAAFGFTTAPGQPVAIGKALEGVETGDSRMARRQQLGARRRRVRRHHRPPRDDEGEDGKPRSRCPRSCASARPRTRYSILGADRFGAGAVDTVGSSIAVAGLDVQQTAPIAQRGIPVVALGEDDRIEEAVEIGGVPDRRALDVDVAARVGGGAVVTWIQQTTSRAENLLGQAKWALIDDAGDVEDRGAFTTSKDAHTLRVVRTGSSAFATWIQGTGAKARWKAAKIDDDGAQLVKAPAGTPSPRRGQPQHQPAHVERHAGRADVVDATTGTVRVAAQRVK